MRRLAPTSPKGSAGGSPAPERGARSAGAVLRGIPLHHEPRVLPRYSLRPSPAAEPAHAAKAVTSQPPADGDAASQASAALRQAYEAGRAAAQDAIVEEALRRGHEAGFERGREEGRRQGLEEGREAGRSAVERDARAAADAAADRIARLDALLSSVPAELARRLEAAEDDMVALCHAAICRILGEELVKPEGVTQAVRQAVREACGGSPLHSGVHASLAIHVHPRDLGALQENERLAAWLGQGQSAAGVRWVADERVRLGGCIVSCAEGTLDARLETQLAALRDFLLQAGSSVGPDPASLAAPEPSAAPELSSGATPHDGLEPPGLRA